MTLRHRHASLHVFMRIRSIATPPLCHLPTGPFRKQFVLLALLALAILNTVCAQTSLPEASTVNEVIQRANNYWITNNGLGDSGWANSAYYTGNQRASRLLGEPAYLGRALGWANANQWKVGPEAGGGSDADSQCCGQTYLDLYRLDPQPERIADIKQRIDGLVASPAANDDWWWIDAFYMAAPTFARLGNLYSDTNYFEKLFLMYDYMKTTRGLFDPTEGLWWRDESYIEDRVNGEKVFWARGNGWVIAGLARVIEQMPTNAPHRAEFVSMFRTNAAALKSHQQGDGMWRSTLLVPSQYPNPETSGTAFFTFAMAWGVRNGLLDAADYTNTISKAWHGMTNLALTPEGRVVYVQAVGAAPGPATTDSTASYGVGAFLLACTEIALLNSNSPSVSAWAGPDEVIGDFGRDGQELVTFDATATEIYRGTANSFSWWTNGSPITTGITAQAALPLGTNVVTLQVSHSDGQTYTDQVVKTVITIPDVIANAGADELIWDTNHDGEETVALDASGTQVSFGTVTSFDWWLGNTWLASGTNAQILLPLGRHEITLKALSSEGPEYTDEVVKFITPGVAVSASSAQVPNYPENTFDDNLNTRWAAQGAGQWIRFDMGRTNTVSAVHIAFYLGNTRFAYFSIESSLDGSNWSTISSNTSSGLTLERQRFAFPTPTNARYIQITGYGNSTGDWNSFTEITIEAEPSLVDADADDLPDAWEEARLGNTSGNAGTHSDDDGLADGDEYVAGTSPTNALDLIELRLNSVEGGMLQLDFLSRAALGPGYTGLERRYALEQTADLRFGPWSALSGWEQVLGDNRLKTLGIVPATASTFYRLRVWLQPAQ